MNQADAAIALLQQLDAAIRSGNRNAEKRLREQLLRPDAGPDIPVKAAQLYWQAGRIEDARKIFVDTSTKYPDDPRVWLTLAVFLCRQKQFEESLPMFEKALQAAPDYAVVRHRYGWALSTIGRTTEAIEQLERAVELDPLNAAAHYLLSTLRSYQPDDPHIEQMREALRQPLPPRMRSRLYFALSRALEQTGQYDEAFSSYVEANKLRRGEFKFDIESERQHVDWLIQTFNAEFFASVKNDAGYDSATPVFIVGMPRSGSTLLEHMLACHPDIDGAGETPLFFQSLSAELGSTLMLDRPTEPMPTADDPAWRKIGKHYVDNLRQVAGFRQRIVDKQLFNYYALGAIVMALPSARIIYCTRDARDMAISCFTTAFREGRPWAYDLDEFCTAWQLHRKLMAHWHKVLPDRIAELKYEDLIDDPEAQLRNLLQHLGVDWSDYCLGFSDSPRPVETSSLGQVSRPLYQDSKGRWQRFRTQLEPWLERLTADQV